MNKVLQRAIGLFFARRGQGDFAAAVIHAVTSRPEVWDAALLTSLQEMDPREDPSRSIDVLTLKGGAAARHLRDTLEPEGAARLLVELKKRHQGGAFDAEDLVAAAQAAGADLSEFIDIWLRTTRLPGFVLKGTSAYRMEDGEGGEPRYQLIVGIQNDEDVDGLVRVSYRVGRPPEPRPSPKPGDERAHPGAGGRSRGVGDRLVAVAQEFAGHSLPLPEPRALRRPRSSR